MIFFNSLILIFAVAMTGCVFATPVVTRFAVWAGAIDRPDNFRRVHKGATPRLGGIGLAFGLGIAVLLAVTGGMLDSAGGFEEWRSRLWFVLAASLIVLVVGYVDDTRAIGPRMKLAGQAAAVFVLFSGGIRIEGIELLRMNIDLSRPALSLARLGIPASVALPSLGVTLFWFLGCMNVWNLIDGMDGLASGVGLLVSGTLALVAIHNQNVGVAVMATALAGSLAGFLLYNWHPACIFLGDSGSLLIGLLIGVIGVQGCMKGPSAISILFPILAMGLPISDTLLAIFRRWVRNLPLSAADRRHVHHLLIGLGLNPWQAALLLYCFSGFLCGAVLLGVALRNERLALGMGLSGCLAFVLIVTSRMNELADLRGDFHARLARGRQERLAAKTAWEAIQRIELCTDAQVIYTILAETARQLGCVAARMSCTRGGQALIPDCTELDEGPAEEPPLSAATAIFRLSSGQDLTLTVSLRQTASSDVSADIAFRFLQRLALAAAERLERLADEGEGPDPRAFQDEPAYAKGPAVDSLAFAGDFEGSPRTRSMAVGGLVNWMRVALGQSTSPVAHQPTLGKE